MFKEEVDKRFNELIKDRMKVRVFYSKNWFYKYCDSDEDEEEVIIAELLHKIIEWLIDTAEKKYITKSDWKDIYRMMGEFIPAYSYGFNITLIAGEYGYDFGNDKRIFLGDE